MEVLTTIWGIADNVMDDMVLLVDDMKTLDIGESTISFSHKAGFPFPRPIHIYYSNDLVKQQKDSYSTRKPRSRKHKAFVGA